MLPTYGVTELFHGSGMRVVFTAYCDGNRRFAYRQGVKNFRPPSTIANIGVFVLMGVLVFPADGPPIGPRPIVVRGATVSRPWRSVGTMV